MNREERRKLKKSGEKLPPKEPTLTLKVSDFDKMIADAEQKAKERATKAAIHEIDKQLLEMDKHKTRKYAGLPRRTYVDCGG